MDNHTQLSKVLAGAAIGAGFAFLFLTSRGHRLLENAQPGQLVLSAESQRLCQLSLDALGDKVKVVGREQLQVKGRREAVDVCRVVRSG